MHILVAEDDAMSRLLLQRAVAALGHTCVVAQDGLEAWELYQGGPFDVLITDWMMPGLEGLDLCRRVRARGDEAAGYTYLILLTSLTDRQDVARGMEAGADDYLGKPLDREELKHRLLVAGRITRLHRLLAEQKAELERFNDRLEEEIDVARRIQTALVPRDLAIEGHTLAMEMLPATQVGGDLIDYVPRPDGAFWLAIGDVTGHGLPAGLIMMMTQSILTALVNEYPTGSPMALLERLNRALHQNVRYRLRHDNYLTLQLIRHDGDGRYVGSGLHGPVLIHRAAGGTVERLDPPGMWIGLVPEVGPYMSEFRFELAPGDTLLLFTDGLNEARNAAGEQYDVDRLAASLARHAALPVGDLQHAVRAEVHDWLQEQQDDISTIVLRRSRSDQD